MCEPISIGLASLALSAGGTLYSASQQAAQARERTNAQNTQTALSAQARDAERTRQQAYDKQAFDQFNQRLGAASGGAQEDIIGAGANQAAATTGQVQTATNADMGLLPDDKLSDVFTADVARQGAIKAADTKSRLASMAVMSGYDRANGYNTVTGSRFDANQRMLDSQRKASLALGQGEENVAAPYVAPANSYGTVAQGLGNLGLQYAGRKTDSPTLQDVFGYPTPPSQARPATPAPP